VKGRRGAALTGAARRSAAAARHASPCPASPPAPCPRPARVRSPAVKQPIADVLPVKRASSGHLRSTLALPAARYGAHKTPTAHANQSDAHILAVPDAGLSLWTCAQAQRNMRAAPHSVSCQPPRCSAPPANSPPTTAQARPLPGARLGDRVAADRQAELQAAKAAAAGQRLAQRQHRERGPDTTCIGRMLSTSRPNSGRPARGRNARAVIRAAVHGADDPAPCLDAARASARLG